MDTGTWCQATYGQKHQVYKNFDERDPPGDEKCPYILIYPAAKKAGHHVNQKTHAFETVCCIYDESLVTGGTENITEYHGVQRLETFRKYIEAAILVSVPSKTELAVMEVEYDTITNFPFMAAGMILEITETVCLGEDPFE